MMAMLPLLRFIFTISCGLQKQMECLNGCECAKHSLDGHWTEFYSVPFYQRISVTPAPKCWIKVRSLIAAILSATMHHSFQYTAILGHCPQ